MLNAPTQEAWITPWVEHLQRPRRRRCTRARRSPGIEFDGRRITGVRVSRRRGAPAERVTADHYVAALPVEQLRLLVTPELRRAEPALARLDRLVTRWMNGIMFYLDRDVPLVHGHAIYIDSAWALTSISQAQFWGGRDLAAQYGDGRVEGILSVDVSEWERPGPRTGKVAAKCTPEEIRAEVWGQLADHLNDGAAPVLDEANVLAWFLDPAIEFPNPTEATNLEPLLDQHRRLVGRPARGRDARSRTSCSPRTSSARTPTSRRWRAPTRRRAARSTRSSTRRGSAAPPLPASGRSEEPAIFAPGAGARQAALAAVPPPGEAAAARHRRRRRGAHRPARRRR